MKILPVAVKGGCLSIALIFGIVIVAIIFGDGPPLGCPNYGVEHSKLSPDGEWLAESGVEGCGLGGDTFIMIRKPSEPREYNKSKRVISFSDFPTIRFNWIANNALEISVPSYVANYISDNDFPKRWRDVDLRFKFFEEPIEQQDRHLIIGNGTTWYGK